MAGFSSTLLTLTVRNVTSIDVWPLRRHPAVPFTTTMIAFACDSFFDSRRHLICPITGRGVLLQTPNRRFRVSRRVICRLCFLMTWNEFSSMMFTVEPLSIWKRLVELPIFRFAWNERCLLPSLLSLIRWLWRHLGRRWSCLYHSIAIGTVVGRTGEKGRADVVPYCMTAFSVFLLDFSRIADSGKIIIF